MQKFSKKIVAHGTQQHIKKIIHHNQLGFVTRVVQHRQIDVIHHRNKRKDKNRTIISINAEEAFENIQHPFMIKVLTKVGTEETYLKTVTVIYDKPTVNIIHNGEKLKAFPLKSGIRQ